MSKSPVLDSISSINELIISGKVSEARKKVAVLCNSKIQRQDILAIARLARRTSQSMNALKLLGPFLYPSGKTASQATEEEWVEYAANLTLLGASEEAHLILKRIDAQKHPDVLLFRSFAFFSEWNYGPSIPLLTEYVQRQDLSEYSTYVGWVNLIAALIRQKKYKNAGDYIEATQNKFKSDFPILYGNLLELKTQLYVFSEKYSMARTALEEAQKTFSEKSDLYGLLVRKWTCILDLCERPKDKKALANLRHFRSEVRNIQTEIYRDCDRFEAITQKDRTLLLFLYFGTPFFHYRKRLLEDFRIPVELPSEYDWLINSDEKNSKCVSILDVSKGKGAGCDLKPGSLLQKLLSTLCLDFYRPLRVTVIHHHLFPGDYFNPIYSPKRVYEAIRRLKNHLDEKKVPLDIEAKMGYYRLVGTRPITLRLTPARRASDRPDLYLLRLKEHWPTEAFTSNEAAQHLELTERSTQRLFNRLIEEGKLVRMGKTRGVTYTFNKKATS